MYVCISSNVRDGEWQCFFYFFNLFQLVLIYGKVFARNSLVPTNYALGTAPQARRHGLCYVLLSAFINNNNNIMWNSSTVATTTPLGADDVCRWCFHLRAIINAEFNRAWKTIMSNVCVCSHTIKIIIITKRGLVAPHTQTHTQAHIEDRAVHNGKRTKRVPHN